MRPITRTGMLAALLFLFFSFGDDARAETGRAAWLRYAPLDSNAKQKYDDLPNHIVRLGDSVQLRSAEQELLRGLQGMLARTPKIEDHLVPEKMFLLANLSSLPSAISHSPHATAPFLDSYWLETTTIRGSPCLLITSPSDRGVLYAVFAFLSKIARLENVNALEEFQQPSAAIRWVNQWDNLDGSIERGYAGPSLWFDQGAVRADLTRAEEYARLLASVGINGCTINNVNADPRVLRDDFLSQIARIADLMRPWGIRLSLAVDLSSPKTIGGLDTFDPLDPKVADWWRQKAHELYRQIPDFAGFVVKADSEDRPGPSTYGRTHADAANMIARALQPHGGIVLYRAFVYNHHLDWRNPKNDRAKSAYDNFHPLDGKFEANVVLQIKYGPIDFQAREPVSPLFAGLQHTNEAIELQVTQEYTGQQRHLVFLAPMWKQILDFDLHAGDSSSLVKDLVSGRTFSRPLGGFVAVVNAGMAENWLAHPFAMANLYAFGRLAWDPNQTAQALCEEWARLTFGNNAVVVRTVSDIALASWKTYENYTGPLGAQTLTDILGSHYGPGIESSEENGWGQWHRADPRGIGMDRSLATGTGFAGQYPPTVAAMYESLDSTPDELLLFFHHVPYTYALHSGKTVVQHIYDSHYQGAREAQGFADQWGLLKGHIDDERYGQVLALLNYQSGHAIVWRDAICNYFSRLSGIPDSSAGAGNLAYRVEAESMNLDGYSPVDVIPWEDASGGKAVECANALGCKAWSRFSGKPGTYEIDVQYFDQNNGVSRFRVWINDRMVDEWRADNHLPATKIGGDSSTRRRIYALALRLGDEIRIEGIPDSAEHAPLDYIEIFEMKGLK
jgi:alpha-glucuronidase